MNITYLIDTDWVIHHLNDNAAVIERLETLHAEGLGLSVIALAELYEGVYYSRNPEESERKLNDFLESVSIVALRHQEEPADNAGKTEMVATDEKSNDDNDEPLKRGLT